MKKIKKIIYSFFSFFILTVFKLSVYATDVTREEILYGPPPSYEKEETKTMLEKIVSFLYSISQKIEIPIVVLIGMIIYFVKSKKSAKHKIKLLIIVGGVYIIFRIGIYLIYESITYILNL